MNITTNEIVNFNTLPKEIREEIKGKELQYRSLHCVQEITDTKFTLCIAGGFKFFENKESKMTLQFEATSYGSDNWQWSWMRGFIRKGRGEKINV